MAENLMSGLLSEIDRVKEVLEVYESLPNNAGLFASITMKADIQRARQSIIEDDTVKMVYYCQALKGYQC